VIRVERRLNRSPWLKVVVPIASVVVAFGVMAMILVVTHHAPGNTFRRLVDAGFVGKVNLNNTLIFATPLLFTGLCAAAAFRMQLFNIGGEGQLYAGAVTGAAAGLLLGNHSTWLSVPAMIIAGALGGAALALIPGVLKAFLSTNEIIVSLMLNYVAALGITYLVFDSQSYWRDPASPTFPQGKPLPDAATWPTLDLGGVVIPFGLILGVVVAVGLWLLYTRTKFGFEVQVIGDSPRAARYAGMRTRRKIVAVFALSGAIAGLGGASQDGDFRHQLDPKGLTSANYGYAGIVIAALGRYNPFAVVLIAFLVGGLQNAGYALQGADFPAGLVGVMQGVILFCALGGEILVLYRIRLSRPSRGTAEAPT
jgi:simple sugar transport system permease protein